MLLPRPHMVEPATVRDAVVALSEHRGAMVLAGATDLIPAMRCGAIRPRVLVNLKRIPNLAGVRRGRDGVSIGALTTIADLLRSRMLAREFPILAEVASDFGSPQIRAMATVGGNLCSAIPSADLPLPLLVLDAEIAVAGPPGDRDIPLSEFFLDLGKTALGRGQLVTAIRVPRPPRRFGAACMKLTGRKAMDVAIVSAAVSLSLALDRASCRSVRVALGAVGPTPVRARRAEAVLEGRCITRELITEAAEVAAAECTPISDLRASAEYRQEMVQVMVRRAALEALWRAGGSP